MILILIILKNFKKNENIKVSYKFIYNILTKEGILSPRARKKSKSDFAKQKLLKEKKINLSMSDEQINTIVNHELALEASHPRGEKPKYFGEVTIVKEKKKYIPPMTHPWKLTSFQRQLKKAHTSHVYA